MKSKKVALLMVFVSLIFVVSCDGFENYLVRKEEQSVIYLGYYDSVIDDPQNGQEKFNELVEKYDLPVIQLPKFP